MLPPNKLTTDYLGRLIYEVRGQRVMLDSDLAAIYGVETKALNRAVKRNANRFPKDFMFEISSQEWKNLKYQIGTSSSGQKSQLLRYQSGTLRTGRGRHRKYLPYVFTEHGAIMAANVLNSQRAVQMAVFISEGSAFRIEVYPLRRAFQFALCPQSRAREPFRSLRDSVSTSPLSSFLFSLFPPSHRERFRLAFRAHNARHYEEALE